MKTPQRYVFEYVKGMCTLVPIEKTPAKDLGSTAGVILAKDFVAALQEAEVATKLAVEDLAFFHEDLKRKVAQLKERLRQVRKTRGKSLRQFEVDDVIDEVFGK